MKVWVTTALQKVRPNDPVPSITPDTIRISAAGNEFEAFQVVVQGTAKNVTAVADWTGGPALPPAHLYREAMITLRRTSSSDPESKTGDWPDALVPDVDEFDQQRRNAFPFSIRGVSQGIWVELFVPAGTTAGDYKGQVTVSADGQRSQTVNYTLHVYGFDLPATASARSAFALAYGALPTAFNFSASDLSTFSDLRYKVGVMGLDHRVSLSRFDDGVWYDLDHFDAAYGPLMTGNYAGKAIRPRLDGATLTSVEYLGPKSGVAGYPSDPQQDMNRWASFYQDKGWLPRLFQYTADEPNDSNGRWADVSTKAPIARAAGVHTLVTTTVDAAAAHGVATLIDVMVPAINFMSREERTTVYPYSPISSYGTFLSYVDAAPPQSQENELWMYQSCMSHDCGGSSAKGWPSYMIDAKAVRNRAMQWLDFSRQATGELYWETGYALYAKRDAWIDQWAYTGNGDGTLFYPGTPAKIGGGKTADGATVPATNIPVASIRLKMIREGMEDFEYLTKLAGYSPGEALDLANTQFPDAQDTGYDGAETALAARREYLACRIAEYMSGSAPSAADTTCKACVIDASGATSDCVKPF